MNTLSTIRRTLRFVPLLALFTAWTAAADIDPWVHGPTHGSITSITVRKGKVVSAVFTDDRGTKHRITDGKEHKDATEFSEFLIKACFTSGIRVTVEANGFDVTAMTFFKFFQDEEEETVPVSSDDNDQGIPRRTQ